MSTVLDGSATGIAYATNVVSATLTTTTANDIICVMAYSEQGPGYLPVNPVSSVSASGLTFALRAHSAHSGHGNYELWWAVASSPLSTKVITITYAAPFDNASLIVFGVSGCNISSPWDNNPSLPTTGALNIYTGSSSGYPSVTVSTSNADDFLIFGVGTSWSWSTTPGTIPTGFTTIATASEASGTLWGNSAVAYQTMSASQTNQTYTWGSLVPDALVTSGASSGAEWICDALTADTNPTNSISPVLDGYSTSLNGNIGGLSLSTRLITTAANDVICVFVYWFGGGTISSVTSPGLTFGLKYVDATGSGNLAFYSAIASSALNAATITVNFTSSYTNAEMIAFGVSGCNVLAPFDPNTSMIATQNGVLTPSVTISTSYPDDFLLFAVASNNYSPTGVVPSGFLPIGFGLIGTAAMTVAYKRISSVQTTTAYSWGSPVGASASPVIAMFSALTADTAGSPTTGTATGTSSAIASTRTLISRYAVGTTSGAASASGFSLNAEMVSKLIGYSITGPTNHTVSKLVGYVIDGPNILSLSKFNGYAIQGPNVLSISKFSGYAIVAGSGAREAIGTASGSSAAISMSNNFSVLSVGTAVASSVVNAHGVFLQNNLGNNNATVFLME